MKIKKITVFLFCTCLLFIASCDQKNNQESLEKEEETSSAEAVNEEVSDKRDVRSFIKLVDLDGQEINLADYEGKTIFLNFWATWCKPCIKEMPSIENAKKQLEDGNIVFLAASDESLEKIQKFKDSKNFTFEFAKLKSGMVEVEVYSLPTTFIINPKGEIIFNEAGMREWDSPEMIAKLKEFSKG